MSDPQQHQPAVQQEEKPKKPSRSLFLSLGCDVAAAFGSACLIAPPVATIDTAIICKSNGREPSLLKTFKRYGLELVTKPHHFVRRPEVHAVWLLYFSTYVAANCTDSLCEHYEVNPALYKMAATTAVNAPMCIWKDRFLTRYFGLKAASGLPWGTYGAFAVRDTITMFASFSAPAIFAAWLRDRHGVDRSTSATVSQLLCPMGVQFISTPIHLLGLDLYNNPAHTAAQRAGLVGRLYLPSALARCLRILPAFGVGGVANKQQRDALRERFAPLYESDLPRKN